MRNLFFYGFYTIGGRLITAGITLFVLALSAAGEDTVTSSERGYANKIVVCRTITEVETRSDGQKTFSCRYDF